LDAVPFERRAALLELMTEVARQAMESGQNEAYGFREGG